ncbi:MULTISPECIES: hypothetical protein [Anaerolinea]|uniref:PepSY domain-containing protein n=1 Tax=Anaerolinea thermophila (strain DSM 14523 / JCM 11388 / NBRC 100420 / UNI-1) TaxID=926569 RepID=E8N0D2_ANATU|nr:MULTISPECIES: hypothetical protein [Anaerolinea]BAJ64681.1 hypothetical protein ANT_26550 [Anaerolinea thermophila UNI-1]
MNKTLGIALLVIAGIVLSALIFGAGLMAGRFYNAAFNSTPFNNAFSSAPRANWERNTPYQGYSMMGGGGMMGNGNNMMYEYNRQGNNNVKPLSIDQAKQAVENYLPNLNNPDLETKEIMIFDNHAYVRIIEKSTGIGAMELLVDPVSLAVFPEHGPNMMWNLKYGMMSGWNGMMGGGMMGGRGMMRGYYTTPDSVSAEMTVTPEQALEAAQQYLDQEFPGYTTGEDAEPFYGYYTIDIVKDGKTTGMLSVNGYTSQVFFHFWHGTFIEMSEFE